MKRVALGLKARTGRAIVVAIEGDLREPTLVERSQFRTLPDHVLATYHQIENLAPAAAEKRVKESIANSTQLATAGIREAVKRVTNAGREFAGCTVLIGPPLPNWTTAQIVAVHVRMHQAEGVLFRDVLVAGAKSCGLALMTLPEKTALDAAAEELGLTRAQLDAKIAALGKQAGAPWGKDQKEAAAGALVALVR